MGRLTPARRLALQTLSDCRRRGAHVRDVLRASEAMAALEARDRALATRLAVGTTAAYGRLDVLLDERLRHPAKIEPRVRDALRIAAFEICYLSTRADAAVSQGVELTRSVAPRAAGLANAVLRRLVREERPRVEEARARCRRREASVEDLCVVGALPAWLVEDLMRDMGYVDACSLALSQLEPPIAHVASNPALLGDEDAYRRLEDAGLLPQRGMGSGSFVLGAPAGLARSGLVDRAEIVPCDPASLAVVRKVAVRPGMRVLEIGQGRATKTILLEGEALRAGGFVDLVGIDSAPFKTEVARRRTQVAGLSEHVLCRTLDARVLGDDSVRDALGGPFDLVFVDAPCSGAGTMRRHPETVWNLGPQDVERCSVLERDVLAHAATQVRPGGTLCYATCSPLRAEDEGVVGDFLATDQGARFELRSPGDDAGCLRTAPGGDIDMDCHFLARLVAVE